MQSIFIHSLCVYTFNWIVFIVRYVPFCTRWWQFGPTQFLPSLGWPNLMTSSNNVQYGWCFDKSLSKINHYHCELIYCWVSQAIKYLFCLFKGHQMKNSYHTLLAAMVTPSHVVFFFFQPLVKNRKIVTSLSQKSKKTHIWECQTSHFFWLFCFRNKLVCCISSLQFSLF